jgi:hypothetical protein
MDGSKATDAATEEEDTEQAGEGKEVQRQGVCASAMARWRSEGAQGFYKRAGGFFTGVLGL